MIESRVSNRMSRSCPHSSASRIRKRHSVPLPLGAGGPAALVVLVGPTAGAARVLSPAAAASALAAALASSAVTLPPPAAEVPSRRSHSRSEDASGAQGDQEGWDALGTPDMHNAANRDTFLSPHASSCSPCYSGCGGGSSPCYSGGGGGGSSFSGSACYSVSSNPTGPTKKDGTPDMRYSANRG